jgi:hypothetical protein
LLFNRPAICRHLLETKTLQHDILCQGQH